MDTMHGADKKRGRPSSYQGKRRPSFPRKRESMSTDQNMDSRLRGKDELSEPRGGLSGARTQERAHREDDAEDPGHSKRVQRPDEEEGAGGALDAHTSSGHV